MASSSRVGNEYSHVHIGGGSNHLGNVYNNYGQSKDDRALQAILKSLSYPGMTDRRDALAEAEEGTFDWTFLEGETKFLKSRYVHDKQEEVYDHHSSVNMTFKTWLEGEDEGLFCVMGKPGSGKSTFMKSLAVSKEMDAILRAWAADKTLIRAEHYFWILGAHMQKSLEGLLRALLHSALLCLSSSEDPEVRKSVEYICERQWHSSYERGAWSCRELKDMLSRLASTSNANVFLLVDALDEWEPQDRLGDLADEMLWISRLPNVKLCVSCRPWAAFTGRFGKAMTLHLHELTYHDMAVYIEKRLVSAEAENDLDLDFRSRTFAAKKLIHEVSRAAEGVFLWTELVAKALCSEVRKGCSMEKLAQIIIDCPTGLENYFEDLIFNRIGKSRQNVFDTAAALKLALVIKSHEGLDLPLDTDYLNFWLLSQQRMGVGFSWTDHDGKWYAPHHVERMVRQTRAYLEETCKDLLVLVDDGHGWNVDFLHRTVYDFLCDSRVNVTLEQHAPSHLSDKDFVIKLTKLRCIYRLREELTGCEKAQWLLLAISCWSRERTNISGAHTSWILACQELLLMRLQTNCDCLGLKHVGAFVGMLVAYAAAGLHEYLIETTMRMPTVAMIPVGDSGNLLRILLQLTTMRHRRPNVRFLRRVLQCGCNPNGFAGNFPKRGFHVLRNNPALAIEYVKDGCLIECKRTSWETWLGEAYLQLQSSTKRVPGHKGMIEEDNNRRGHMFGEFVQALLQHGADPCVMPCVTDHRIVRHWSESGGLLRCSRLPLSKLLDSIIPAERMLQLQPFLITSSEGVNNYSSGRNQQRRAIRSLLISERTFLSQLDNAKLSPEEELHPRSEWRKHQDMFLRSLMGLQVFPHKICQLCSDRRCTVTLISWCIDCSRTECLCFYCAICSHKDTSENPTLEHPCKTLSNIHAGPAMKHMTITLLWNRAFHEKGKECNGDRDRCRQNRSFKTDPIPSDDPQFGLAQAISVLKEWYAKDPIELGDLLEDDLEGDLEGTASLQELSLT